MTVLLVKILAAEQVSIGEILPDIEAFLP